MGDQGLADDPDTDREPPPDGLMRTPAPKRPWRSPSSGSVSSSGPTPFKQPRVDEPPGVDIEAMGGV
jgi:hypothetical protein